MSYTPRAYIAKWLDQKRITIDARGTLLSEDNREFNDLFDTLYLDYCEQISQYNKVAEKDSKSKLYSDKEILRALNEYMSLEILAQRTAMISLLKCPRENLVPIDKFVTAIVGAPSEKISAILAHFVWMMKRKLNGHEVVFHIMPIIFGKQGAGKSYAIEKFLSPITNLTLRIRVTELTDPRFYFSLNKNFAVFLDEMAGATKTDVEVLKNQITATYLDARKLSTNNVSKLKQNCSIIGATNKPVSELIYDPTGARRFYEIRSADLLDWDAINAIDYLELYKGVDETKPRGYIEPYLKEIAIDQESLVGVDELGDFLEHHGISTDGTTKEISCNGLYDIYKVWAENNGVRPLSNSWFGRKIGNRGVKSQIRRLGNRAERFYMINESSSVHRKSGIIGDPLAAVGKVWS